MSNLIAATTQPAGADAPGAWLFILPWLLVAGLMLARTGLFRGEAIVGPPRMAGEERGAFFVLLFLMTLAAGIVAGSAAVRLPVTQEWRAVVASAAIYAAGIPIIIAANALARPRGLERFGLTLRQAGGGLWRGAAGLLALMPLVLAVGMVVDLVSSALEIPIPQHDLLSQLRGTDSVAGIALLVLVAVVLAPLYEEMMFRGLMQTFLVRVLSGRETAPAPQGFEVIVAGEPLGTEPSTAVQPEATEAAAVEMPRRILARWLAIAVTSLIFAAVHGHSLWIPPLLVLSMGLGYAYERTGNLWVPIAMHALFNGLQIVLFLIYQN